jgi:2'-5' RNA ligase
VFEGQYFPVRAVRSENRCRRGHSGGSLVEMNLRVGSSREERHEFWRIQLLDELYWKLTAIQAEPALDPKGRRRAALRELISRFEQIELDALRRKRGRTLGARARTDQRTGAPQASNRENRSVQIAYVILLPDDVHNFIRRVQVELYDTYAASEATRALEPHITLKQPFEAGDAEPYEDFFDRLTVETDPFELELRGYGFFEGEGVVFLDVTQNERLHALQRRILEELALEPAQYESGSPLPYHFHATVATGLSPDDLTGARDDFDQTPEFRFPLERLGMFRRDAEGPWTLYKRSKL